MREAMECVGTSKMAIIAVTGELGRHETALFRWIVGFGVSATTALARWASSAAPVSPIPVDLAAKNARLKHELH